MCWAAWWFYGCVTRPPSRSWSDDVARIASEQDFLGGGLYDGYQEFPYFANRAAWIQAQYPGVGKIAVIGCAYGYLVKHLRLLGLQAWGYDLSQWALNRVDPAAAPYCMFVDATRQQDRRSFKQLAGISVNGKFSLAITEDVLPVLTENEAGVLVSVCQSDADNTLHIIMATHPEIPGDLESRFAPITWKPQSEWRQLVNAAGGSTHRCLDVELWTEF
jgi:hypothetical protein